MTERLSLHFTSLHFQSPMGSYHRGSWEINLCQEGETR